MHVYYTSRTLVTLIKSFSEFLFTYLGCTCVECMHVGSVCVSLAVCRGQRTTCRNCPPTMWIPRIKSSKCPLNHFSGPSFGFLYKSDFLYWGFQMRFSLLHPSPRYSLWGLWKKPRLRLTGVWCQDIWVHHTLALVSQDPKQSFPGWGNCLPEMYH